MLRRRPRPLLDRERRQRAVGRDAITNAQQFALAVVFLPHQAVVSADAIIRTLYRLFISHRKLLEWQTASQVERTMGVGSQRVLIDWTTLGDAESAKVFGGS